MVQLSAENKKLIDDLTDEGERPSDICKITGINYKVIYNYLDQAAKKLKRDILHGTKYCDHYVETGRELPPIQRSECVIIPNSQLAELVCEQMGLKPPVCSLSQRPMSYSATGWVRTNNKWVVGQPKKDNIDIAE